MQKKNVIACLASLALVATVSAKDLTKLDKGIKVMPERVASCQLVNGEVVRTGEWMPYTDSSRGCCQTGIAFDAFEPDGGCPGYPTDVTCGMGGSRWLYWDGTYFNYCNGAATNDMTVVTGTAGGQSTRVEFAWYWYGAGFGGSEECDIALFTGEAFEEDCTGFGAGYSGILYGFGDLATDPGGYYFTDADLCDAGLSHQIPFDNDGSTVDWYQTIYLTAGGGAMATCAQPCLWAGKDAATQGSSGDLQYDDDNPRDGAYTVPDECYSYGGLVPCPDNVGAMAIFYSDASEPDPCADNGCAASACVFKKLKCKSSGKLIASGTGTAGNSVCIQDGADNFVSCATVNGRDKWKKKQNGQSGAQTRKACGTTKTANCP